MGVKNWVYHFKEFIKKIGMEHTCIGKMQPIYSKNIFMDMEYILYEFYHLQWYGTLFKVDGRQGNCLNKFRTSRNFKGELGVEYYIVNVWSKQEHSAFAKFRC